MIKYKTLVLGEMGANCYLLWDEDSRQALIIDPGDEADYVSQEIELLQIKPELIAVTHGHFDHVLGGMELKLIYGVDFACSSKDQFLLDRGVSSAEYFLKKKQPLKKLMKIDIDLDKIDELRLGSNRIEVIKTPGHTPGSVCFYIEKQDILISGDTIFQTGIGRTDFAYSSEVEMKKSLETILELPGETLLLPGHDESTTIAEWKRLG